MPRPATVRLLLLSALLLGGLVGVVMGAAPSAPTQTRPDWDTEGLIRQHTFAEGDFTLHYAESGTVGGPTVVFIHGTPGSWRSLGRMMIRDDLRSRAHLVSIDRPGWGLSPLPDGRRSEPDFDAQIALITPLLRQLKEHSGGQPLLLVGHSYGGSIAPYIAFRHPELVDGILMAASAIDPELGKPRWYNYAARTWLVSPFLGDGMRKANDEIWGVYDALERLTPWWQQAKLPLIFLQGEEDELVDPRNLDFAERALPAPNTTVMRLPEQGHLLQVQRRDLLASLTLQLLDEAQRRAAVGD
ncbi:MAG: alpha/beta fold hydrolase [Pseudomonadales bacterium]|nr:alpha/beta fold hydrolase [Pseudomonadales bacterium]MCP5357368.1 alpha/beta fold hydrolase [Pseudomonadales bacterium]